MNRHKFICGAFAYAVALAAGTVFAEMKETQAVVPDVKSWHGANLLGLFNAAPQKPDRRVRGHFEECYFRWMKDWGFNFARLPMDYRFFLATNDWTRLKLDGFAKVDEAVAWGRKYGVHVQLCLHRAPGFTILSWIPEKTRLQTDREPQEAFMRIWREFARRYRGIPNSELSFNLINEPSGFSEQQFIDVFGRTIDAIRAVDPGRFVMLDGNNVASTPVPHFYKVPLTGQAFRGYTPHAISHYRAWYIKEQPEVEPTWPLSPEMAARKQWIYELPETTFEKYGQPRKIGYPVMVGEFGCYNKLKHETCLAWMEHCLRIWQKEGLGWAIWNVDGPFGFMDSDRTDIEYEDFEGHKLDRKMLDLLRRYAARGVSSPKDGVSVATAMTYNVRVGLGDKNQGWYTLPDGYLGYLPQCARVIREAKPDWVAIEEIDNGAERTGKVDQTVVLAKLTGMKGVFRDKVPYQGGQYGLALLLREDPISVRKIELGGPPKDHMRILIAAELKDKIVCSTHFSLDHARRMEAVAKIRAEFAHPAKPVFIGGDFNFEPDSPEFAELAKDFVPLSGTSLKTFPSHEPRITIDYIFVDRAHAGRVTVESVSTPETDLLATDHRPVVVRYRLEN